MILTVIVILLGFILMVGTPLYFWYKKTYNANFTILVFTVQSPLTGANFDVVKSAIKACIPGGFLWMLFICTYYVLVKRKFENRTFRIILSVIPAVMAVGCVILLVNINITLEYTDYLKYRYSETTFIEEHYVRPDPDAIKPNGQPKNLLYIYMESLETGYAAQADGGRQPGRGYIPNLTQIAFDNLSFSNTDKLGGFYNCAHTGWTSAALFSTQSGIPFMTPVGEGGIWEVFPSLITIGDILEKNGYEQEFICGSDGHFGGRTEFFTAHGNYKIMDYYAAVDAGYVDEDHYVWWGFEDSILYDITKKEIDNIVSSGQRFDMTILTVDTHDDGGYVCDLCENEYDVQLANVLSCADRQLLDFLDWCRQQSWYDDTLIVIQGDHPGRTKYLMEEVPPKERTTYNCFINSGYDKDSVRCTNRTFTSMDMMPTVLSALGFDIPGDRLGIGTNLFSDKPTLAEEFGFEYMDEELEKHSQWFLDNIVWGEPVN